MDNNLINMSMQNCNAEGKDRVMSKQITLLLINVCLACMVQILV